MTGQGKTLAVWLQETAAFFAEKGLEDPRREARVLLREGLDLDFTKQYQEPELILSEETVTFLNELVRRRGQREPMSGIFHRAYFYGRDFTLNEACLAPRPESELMVDLALQLMREAASPPGGYMLAELFAGSGAVGLTLLAELMRRNCTGHLMLTDISARALEAARENAQALQVASNCSLYRADLYPADRLGEHYHYILANPPYIPSQEIPHLMPEVRLYEPKLALDGGPDGLDFYRRLARIAPELLEDGGWLIMEHGTGQAADILEIFSNAGHNMKQGKQLFQHRALQDYNGLDRTLALQYIS